MRSIHADAFQGALAPIPRNRVVRVWIVPDDLRSTVEGEGEYDPNGEEVIPRRTRFAQRCSRLAVHILQVLARVLLA